jgi:AcrR family transcriptional regulator
MAEQLTLEDTRRTQIVAAARKSFSRKGYDAATVDDIAEAAGVSKGLIYHYFRSKEDILVATAEAWVDTFEEYMSRLAMAGDTASSKLRAVQRLHMEETIREWDFVLVQAEFWSELLRRPEIARRYARMFRNARSLLATIIEQGIADGEFRPVAAKEVASLMMAMIDGLTLQRLADKRAFSWRSASVAMDDLLFNGLLGREDKG